MVQKYFNFNNEADLTPVDVDTETGRLTPVDVDTETGRVSLDIGDRHSEFDSLQTETITSNCKMSDAEFDAIARKLDELGFDRRR